MKKILLLFMLPMVCITSCKKTAETIKELPYYQFSTIDREWLKFKKGDSMIFENSLGSKLKYVATQLDEVKCPGYGSTWRDFVNPVTYYESHYRVYFYLIQNSYSGFFEFTGDKRIPANTDIMHPPFTEGRFMFSMYYSQYNSITGGRTLIYNTQIPPVENITINGVVYPVFINQTANGGSSVSTDQLAINFIYYSPKYGPLKLTDINGINWVRIL